MCWIVGRSEAAVGYSDAGRMVIGNDCDEVPYGIEGLLGCAYQFIGQPDRSVEWYRAQLARGRDTHTLTRSALVQTLKIAGCAEEAMAAATGLIDAAEATRNPFAISFALMAYGFAFGDADPGRARDALRRGLVIAQDSGNRDTETFLTACLARLEADSGDLLAALEYSAVAIRNFHDSGFTANMRSALATLVACLDRLGCYEPAAVIVGFAFDLLTAAMVPQISTAIAHLREVLGDHTYESLACKGETMTTAAMETYANDEIDQARTELAQRGTS